MNASLYTLKFTEHVQLHKDIQTQRKSTQVEVVGAYAKHRKAQDSIIPGIKIIN